MEGANFLIEALKSVALLFNESKKTHKFCLWTLISLSLFFSGCEEEKNNVSMEVKDGNLERNSSICSTTDNGETKPISKERLDALEKKLGIAASDADKTSGTKIFRRKLKGVTDNEYEDGKICFYEFKTQLGSGSVYLERIWGNDDLVTDLEADFKAVGHACQLLSEWMDEVLAKDKVQNREKVGEFINGPMLLAAKNFITYKRVYQKEEDRIARFIMYLTDHFKLDIERIREIKLELGERVSRYEAIEMNQEKKNETDGLGALLLVTSILIEYGLPENPELSAYLRNNPIETKSAEFAEFIMERPESQALMTDSQNEPANKKLEPIEILFNGLTIKLIDSNFFGPDNPRTFSYTLAIPENTLPVDILTNGTSTGSGIITWQYSSKDKYSVGQPPFAYASWCKLDEDFQNEHFGKILVDKNKLLDYTFFIIGLNPEELSEWERVLEQSNPSDNIAELLKQNISWSEEKRKILGFDDVIRLFEPPKSEPGK